MKTNKNVVSKVMQFIDENLEFDLDLDTIADHAGYSKFHLNRMFMEETGYNIYKYLQEKRLSLAAHKLTTTDTPIVQIAYEAGYQSQQAFTLAFRKMYSYPPNTYRNLSLSLSFEKPISISRSYNNISFHSTEVMAA